MRAHDINRIAQPRKLSLQQTTALAKILQWRRGSKQPFYYLAGLAGTGKTELAVRLQHELPDLSLQYCSFTGKAASVLRQRGADNAVTMHSLLYGPPQRKHKNGADELVWT